MNCQEERKELWESEEQKRERVLPLSRVLFVTDTQQLREFPNNPQKLGSESTTLDYEIPYVRCFLAPLGVRNHSKPDLVDGGKTPG